MQFFRSDIMVIQKINVYGPQGVFCGLKTIQLNRKGALLVSFIKRHKPLQPVGRDFISWIRYTYIQLWKTTWGLKQLMKMLFWNIPTLNMCRGKQRCDLLWLLPRSRVEDLMDAFLSPWEKSNSAHLFFPAIQIPIILVLWMLAHSALLLL